MAWSGSGRGLLEGLFLLLARTDADDARDFADEDDAIAGIAGMRSLLDDLHHACGGSIVSEHREKFFPVKKEIEKSSNKRTYCTANATMSQNIHNSETWEINQIGTHIDDPFEHM